MSSHKPKRIKVNQGVAPLRELSDGLLRKFEYGKYVDLLPFISGSCVLELVSCTKDHKSLWETALTVSSKFVNIEGNKDGIFQAAIRFPGRFSSSQSPGLSVYTMNTTTKRTFKVVINDCVCLISVPS